MIWIVLIPAVLILLGLGWIFNRLVSLSKRAEGAWSDIDVQLKRRWDLVPALVETVKGYARHETQTLENVVRARSEAAQAQSPGSRGSRESVLTSAVRDLFVLAENYPELKAAQNYQNLHHSLVEIEDSLQYARRYYNAVVRDLSTWIESFPSNIVASIFRFQKREFFQLENDSESAVPHVDLEK